MRDMDPSDQGEGLFVTRDIKRGELVSFFSGRLLQEDIVSPLHRRRRSLAEMMQLKKLQIHFTLSKVIINFIDSLFMSQTNN